MRFAKWRDFWLFVGILQWVAIGFTGLEDSQFWHHYVQFGLTLFLSQLPVLIFVWNKEKWLQLWPLKKYIYSWLACFAIYLPFVMLVVATFWVEAGTTMQELLVVGSICTLSLECVLVINTYYFRRLKQIKWVQRLSLEKAILISIATIALILAAMAVSSLNNPEYDKKDQLLIGYEFVPSKIVSHFGLFLSYAAQLLLMYLCGYFFFYVNSKILVPHILRTQGILIYALSGLTVIAVFYPFMGQMLNMLPLSQDLGGVFSNYPFVLENAFGPFIILIISLPVLLAGQWLKQNNLIVSLEREKSQTELDLLKQQLNPHFFFNTLNNLYALSLQKSEQTPESILQLSELMRYVIYKAKEPYVRVGEEVKYLEDYLQLQRIRLRKKLDLQFTKDIADESVKIAPLLLIVFIENAFKHGIEPAESDSFLHINIHADAQRLHFTCKNSFEPAPNLANEGIGLANLQKRLGLQYPGRYRVNTVKDNGIFEAELELQLS
ncbi:sensor histidine kinase [Dyadobacter pollutisoli]|nr:sensor histidine kinase [Dyadobacter pollutisoli]